MKILADGLPKGVVKTRREVVSVEESPSGATLRFGDGSTEGPFDLVVGADGIKGAARKAVRAARGGGGSGDGDDDAIYSGIRIQYGVAPAGQRPKGCVCLIVLFVFFFMIACCYETSAAYIRPN